MVTYTNRDFMTTLSASDVALGIKDGVDNIHSGIIKVLENAARGNYILDYNTASFTQLAGSTRTSFGFSAAINYMRDGVVTSADPTSVELASDPDANNTRYDMIVIATGGALACRTGTASSTPRVIDSLSVGDIPVALVEVLAGASDKNVYNRRIQLYGYNKATNAVSVAYEASNTYTETLTMKGASGGTTIANTVNALSVTSATDINLTSGDDVTITLGDNAATSKFAVNNLAGEEQLGITGAGVISLHALPAITLAADDKVIVRDTSGTDALSTVTAQAIADLGGDITGVALTAATGIDITSVSNATAGDYAATIGVDVSDFMANGANNRLVTALTTDTMNAEANLTFNGSTLAVTGALTTTTTINGGALVTGVGIKSTLGYEGIVLAVPAGATPVLIDCAVHIYVIFATANNTDKSLLVDPNVAAGKMVKLRSVSPVPIIVSQQGSGLFWNATGMTPTITLAPNATVELIAIADNVGVNAAGADQLVQSGPAWIVIGN
tara:strand:- start:3930 stop:5432 length:1503 start_codon:yes stop_codon:yes gene_type:complete